MKAFMQDLKTALKNMFHGLLEGLIGAGKIALVIVSAAGLAVSIGYGFVAFFWQTLTTAVVAILGSWLIVELNNARIIREKKEQQEAYWAEKSKPAHPEYKEQL